MTDREQYRAQMDALSFGEDFPQRTAQLLRQAAHRKETASMKNNKTIKAIIAAAAAFVLLTGSAFAVSALLSARDVAQQLGDEYLVSAFESEGAVSINQTAVVGDYELTLLGIASGEQLDFINDQTIENRHSYVVLAAKRTDGTPIAPEDGLEYDDTGREFAISPLIEGWAPHQVNAWSLNCAGHGITVDGVRYYLFDYTNLELFADRTVYLAVYEGLAPSIERFTLREDGTITFAEGYTGEGHMFTLPVDPSRADREAALALLEANGIPEEAATTPGEVLIEEEISTETVTVEIGEDGTVTVDGYAEVLTDGTYAEIIYEGGEVTTSGDGQQFITTTVAG